MKIIRVIKTLVLIILVAFSTSACNKYLTVKTNSATYYGAFNRRDMIHADVKLYKLNSDVYCDGVIFLNAPSRSITFKNDLVDAKMFLSCSDGKLIDSNLQFRKASFDKGFGEGVDQLNNKYVIEEISKNDFKENINLKNIQFINDKSDSLIMY